MAAIETNQKVGGPGGGRGIEKGDQGLGRRRLVAGAVSA